MGTGEVEGGNHRGQRWVKNKRCAPEKRVRKW